MLNNDLGPTRVLGAIPRSCGSRPPIWILSNLVGLELVYPSQPFFCPSEGQVGPFEQRSGLSIFGTTIDQKAQDLLLAILKSLIDSGLFNQIEFYFTVKCSLWSFRHR